MGKNAPWLGEPRDPRTGDSRPEPDGWATWFSLSWMRKHPILASSFIRERYAWKGESIEQLMDVQVQLFDMYFRGDLGRKQLNIGPSHGGLLSNGVNNVLTTVESIRVLLAHGWNGSVRMLQRLALETLLVTKHSILNPKAEAKWFAYTDGGKPIGITPEIFANYWPGESTPLQGLWKQFSSTAHATAYAQQPLAVIPRDSRSPIYGDLEESAEDAYWNQLFQIGASVHEGLDVTMAILTMLNHLLFPHYREVTRSVQVTYWTQAMVDREKMLRETARTIARDYWRRNAKDDRELNDLWYPAVQQFQSKWK